jgi:hypothetical protein
VEFVNFCDSLSCVFAVVNAVAEMRSWSPGVEIFWVNIYAPRSDVAAAAPTINAAIQQVANSDPLFHVIDWYSYAKGNPTYAAVARAFTDNVRRYTYADQLHPAQTQTRANWIYGQMQSMLGSSDSPTNTNGGSNTGGSMPDVLNACQYKGVAGNCSTR